jgi:3-oxosteroid 1-dehydrogenase
MPSHSIDLVVVGAGASGLLAAAAARRLGDRVLVVEADAQAGGSTAGGSGEFWLPANPLQERASQNDSVAEATEYLQALLGAAPTPEDAARRAAFLRTAPKLARWLVSSKMPITIAKGPGDRYPVLPGAKTHGRTLQTGPFDRRQLGDAERTLIRGAEGFAETLARLPMALPLPRPTVGGGDSLVAHLLHRAVANGVELWLDSPVVELLSDGDAVTGVVVNRSGTRTEVSAKRVLLAGGGFESNENLRQEYLPLPTSSTWSTTSPLAGDGKLMELAIGLGAATSNLRDAWWIPVMLADGEAHSVAAALAAPHSLLVDSAGDRFLDETSSSYEIGRTMYEHSRAVRAVPSYLIGDQRHRQSTALGPWPKGNIPRRAIEAEEIIKANTLNDLAQATGLDRAGLLGTVVRFNSFAGRGTDTDFGRGTPEEGGRSKRKNPALGKIDKPPFWAVKVYPGDTGTRGGLTTDAAWRVIRNDATAIPGLYACAGTAASLYTGLSPAPGAALGEALVGAFLAVTDRRRDAK